MKLSKTLKYIGFVTLAGVLLSSCTKTKYGSGDTNPTPTPNSKPGTSPNEPGTNRQIGDAPANPVNPTYPGPNPYNPQPVVTATPLPPVGQLPPKVVEVPGLGGKPVQTIPPKWEPAPLPSIPADKVLLQLRVVQLNYEAWWKNCLTISIAGDTKEVGCNKTTALNTTVNFLADKNKCNKLDVRVKTYFPKAGACSPGFACNGPYNEVVDIDRLAADIPSLPFFKAYDRNNIMSRDPLIAIGDSTSEIKAQMDSFARNIANNRWVRIYFEDQTRANLDAVMANLSNTALRVERGIDFNDYVFDIRGEGVAFYIDGLEPMGCTRQ
ncbi:MAG: hypothetical protein FJY29_08240 [Betaproteobacteria bacterium]|nr:hypothetical protein [Betaproteobacteria bacterium]